MEKLTNPEESSNAITVQMDVHHRHCSQLSASVTTRSHVCVNETQATSYLSPIHRGHPKTAAERMQEYRARKKKKTLLVNHQKHKKSGAERAREYRIRKKAKIQSADSTMEISTNPEESSNAVQVEVRHRHCSELSASNTPTSHGHP
ncbi:jg24237, partial [Pararge aegeria aegeria]